MNNPSRPQHRPTLPLYLSLALFVAVVASPLPTRAATYTVTTTQDQGPGSLRDAMATIDAAPATNDTVVFNIPAWDPGCSPANHCTLKLSMPLGVTTNMLIDGSAQHIALDANGADGIFRVFRAQLDLNALTLMNATDSAVSLNMASLDVTNSTFLDNSACSGGAIIAFLGGVTVVNSTFVGNVATNVGDCHGAYFGGGAISLGDSEALIVNSTFSGNSAVAAGAGGILGGVEGNVLLTTLQNSILSASVGGNCSAGFRFTDGGGNLDDDGSCGFTVSAALSHKNPRLGPLQDNGGPTPTLALQEFSAAIDVGVDVLDVPGSVPYDQRGAGYPRKLGAHIDSGAYESTPRTIYIPKAPSLPVKVTTPCVSGQPNCIPLACCGPIDPGLPAPASTSVTSMRISSER